MAELISLVEGDALAFQCDVLILKYAQEFNGVDKVAFNTIFDGDVSRLHLPRNGEYICVREASKLGATSVVLIGTPPPRAMGYGDIQTFARSALEICAKEFPDAEVICLTIHGVNIGLDEAESLYSEIVGLREAISLGSLGGRLRSIVIIERDERRVERLREALRKINAESGVSLPVQTSNMLIGRDLIVSNTSDKQAVLVGNETTLETKPRLPGDKPSIFVAMPFAEAMDDVFYYGIRKPIESVGMLCERADLDSFTGNVMERVKLKISTAELVIADLTMSNPNVYLEVGFAWELGRQTVLVARKDSKLKFDIQDQRCILYKSIVDLEERLRKELQALLRIG